MFKYVHLFFEQSGTFKSAFNDLGILASDYDLKNDFDQTDVVIDLFNEIELAYHYRPSVFDAIEPSHLIFAFFPCDYFSEQSLLASRCDMSSIKNYSDIKKLEYSREWQSRLNTFYDILSKLIIVCLWRNLPLIIENPYSSQHYLTRYFPIKPQFIDYDRRQRGDFFQKPTQFFVFNFELKSNFIIDPLSMNSFPSSIEKLTFQDYNQIAPSRKVARSMISKDYALRFIKEFLLDGGEEQ